MPQQSIISNFFAPKTTTSSAPPVTPDKNDSTSSKENELSASPSPPSVKRTSTKRRVILESDDSLDAPVKASPKKMKVSSPSLKKELVVQEKSPSLKKEKQKIPEEEEEEEPTSSSKASSPSSEKKKKQEISTFFQPVTKKTQSQEEKKDIMKVDYEYCPIKEEYHPVADAIWNQGEDTPYRAFAMTLEQIEATSSRLKMIDILANFFRSVGVLSPSDLTLCANLTLNQLGPAYDGLELGIGESIISKAIIQTTGSNMAKIKSEMNTLGDLGLVAASLKSKQRTMMKPKPLTMRFIFQKLREVALLTGNASQMKKSDLIGRLLVACTNPSEAKYLVRALQGKLRIGLAEQSVLAALGQAVALTPFHRVMPVGLAEPWAKNETFHDVKLNEDFIVVRATKPQIEKCVTAVKTGFCQRPDFEPLIHGLMLDGPDELATKHCAIRPGIPLRPMLAHPTKGVDDLMRRFDSTTFSCEYKYDGERAQIHVLPDSSTVQVYSRNQENNTSKYPDIVKVFTEGVLPTSMVSDETVELLRKMGLSADQRMVNQPIRDCIIDSEAVAWDREKEQILPFQILSTRKRKDVKEDEVKVQVCIYAFDLLYFNGISLIRQTFRERRELLRLAFGQLPGQFHFATSLDSEDTEKIGEFLDQAIKGNCEGLMVKTLDENSTYEIAKRSHNWLKLKKDYLEGVGDTLDLVPIGAFHGSGKRAGLYGAFLLACYEPDEEQYQTICKLGTGLSDADLNAFTEKLKATVISEPRPYYSFNSSLQPDVWFDVTEVWEIKAADMSISPAHRAAEGMADPEKGISLRFPRFVRLRPDKKVEDATSASQIYEMYMSQEQIRNQTESSGQNNDEQDYY